MADVEAGLKRLYPDQISLREWAAVLLSVSNLIDLADLEEETTNDELLDLLWGLSFGEDAWLDSAIFAESGQFSALAIQ